MENNQRIKTVKAFKTVNKIVDYLKRINYQEKTVKEIKGELKSKALIKYGSILILHDPYELNGSKGCKYCEQTDDCEHEFTPKRR